MWEWTSKLVNRALSCVFEVVITTSMMTCKCIHEYVSNNYVLKTSTTLKGSRENGSKKLSWHLYSKKVKLTSKINCFCQQY